ncbi:hypothetical protein SAMN05192583_0576 [Sphingomonas gellani]|uniref:Uncharacterized protein n=1 Tax=Sphingomonas gellani TaxID=1166340 RepID=A0A1H7Z8D5_9SPHN|nr:hypothetical protein [Sphingomonas gellani]SEM54535.1 hypothetical protein SAMN05192583_0576 [Sphingomonas gellani]
MEIIRLPEGEVASETCDCIQIQTTSDGRFELAGSALMKCGDSDVTESVSITGGQPYATYEAAEAAGLAWANELCVEQVHVARSRGDEELPDIYDRPEE